LTPPNGIQPRANSPRKSAIRFGLILLALLSLAALIYARAAYNLAHVDFRNSNFFVFWLAGKMVGSGQDPYNAAQWAAGHDAYGVTWRPNETFLYPLPLAFVVAPLGLLPLAVAYFGWQLLSQSLIALVIWSLLRTRSEPRFARLFFPLVVSLTFFGPAYLTLQVGALGALTLAAIWATIAALDSGAPLLAGALLAIPLLKPSQGAPIAVLAAIWMLARRDWRALWGLLLGMLALMALGMLGNPLWIAQFLASSRTLLLETLGRQANLLSAAYLLCGRNLTCTGVIGGLASLLVLSACAAFLWRRRSILSSWEAFNLIIPVAFVSTIYLWSYDQILYIIPIVWIAVVLLERSRSYLRPFAWVLVIVLVSLVALANQANQQTDLWSTLTTVLVFGSCAALGFHSGYIRNHAA
jgi:hypothetical protein